VVETERQVVKHLEEHEAQIPESDQKTHAILQQMKKDEAHHADIARSAGGAELPPPVKGLMQLASKVMTHTAYWI
jgi:ubiquinone biosynthesis monooxygenase Coq7